MDGDKRKEKKDKQKTPTHHHNKTNQSTNLPANKNHFWESELTWQLIFHKYRYNASHATQEYVTLGKTHFKCLESKWCHYYFETVNRHDGHPHKRGFTPSPIVLKTVSWVQGLSKSISVVQLHSPNQPCSFWFSFSILSSRICCKMAFFHSSRSSRDVLFFSSCTGPNGPASHTGSKGERGGSSPNSE